MSIDALFPARVVLEPFFNEGVFPAPTNPAWAQNRPIEREALALAEPVMRMMALAGWRASNVHYSYFDVGINGLNADWANIDLKTRICTQAQFPDGGSSPVGNATLVITLERLTDGGQISHAFMEAPALDSEAYFTGMYNRWRVEGLASGTLRLIWETYPDPSRAVPDWQDNPTSIETWNVFWEERRSELAEYVLEFCADVGLALAADMRGVISAAGNDLSSADLPGLTWLFDPATWASEANARFRDDNFVNVVKSSAEKVWNAYKSNTALDGLVMLEISGALTSLQALLKQQVVEAQNWTYVADQGENYSFSELTPADAVARDSPFYGMPESVSYFDLICALVQNQRILPPALENLGLVGNFIEEADEELDEEGSIFALHGEFAIDGASGREAYIDLYVFGEFALRLIQTAHPRDPTMAPDLGENSAWEYKGLQQDGRHVVALTVGRGVRLQEISTSMDIKFDVFRANSRHEFRRPLPRPAHLDPVEVPSEELALLYELPEDGEDFSQDVPFMADDLSATAAQALDHTILRQPRVFQCHVPDTLTNIPSWSAVFSNSLVNFDTQSPPVLVVRYLDCGGVRFEWFRDGLVVDDPQVTFGMTVRPNVPANVDVDDPNAAAKDASFGIAWSLDYGFLTRKPLSEDALAEYVAAVAQDAAYYGLSVVGLPTPSTFVLGMEPGNVPQEVFDFFKPHGVGFFRVWYSGDDVRIDIDRYSDSDESFRPEIVKVAHAMDLPEQGYRLPSRAAEMGDYVRVGTPVNDTSNTGFYAGVSCYDAMLDPESQQIPTWRAQNMPPWLQRSGGGYYVEALAHVGALRSYSEKFIASWVAGITTYSDVEHFIISPLDWDSWESYFGSSGWTEQDNRIPGILNMTATTDWMVFTILVDVVVGFIPYVGTSVDVAEFLYALETGEDKWGEPVATWQLVLMGVAASIPFVSGSAVKGVSSSIKSSRLAKSLMGDSLPEVLRRWTMAGEAGEDLLKLLGMWVPTGKSLDEADKMEAATTIVKNALEMTPTGAKMDPKAVIQELSQMTVTVLKEAGSTAGGIAARSLVHADASFILTMVNGAVVQIRVPALADAFFAARNANPGLTWRRFLNRRKYTTGANRAIADMFGLITYSGVRVSTGVPKGGGAWVLMGDLSVDAARRLLPGEMLTRLRGADIVDTIKASLEAAPALAKNEAAIGYLVKYGDPVKRLLGVLDAEGMLAKVIGSKEFDDEYVIVGLARVLEHFDDALKNSGSAERVMDLFPAPGQAGDAALAALSPLELARRSVLLEAISEFSGMALRQVKFPHAYDLELDLGILMSKKVVPDVLEVSLQVTSGGRKGADGAAFTPGGFIVIEAKALARAAQQFGASGVQPNMVQALKTIHRMVENIRNPVKNGPLDDGFVPAFSQNVFQRAFIFLVDRAHLARNGQTEAVALFEYAGRELEIPSEVWNALPADTVSKLRDLADVVGSTLYFSDLGKWFQASQLMGVNGLDKVFKRAMKMQADDIVDALLAMQTRAQMQALLDEAGTLGSRTSAVLAAFVNTRKNWPGLVHEQKLAADYFLGAGKADEFFDILGISDGWMDILKNSPDDLTEALDFGVTLVTREGLANLGEAAFRAHPRKAAP